MLHVTEAIKICGLMGEFGDKFAVARGTAIHLATALDDEGALDEASVDPRIAAEVSSYRTWKDLVTPAIKAIELKMESRALGLCGTLDRLIQLADGLWIVDLKSGAKAEWHRYQTALYAILWSTINNEPTPKRANLYLSPDRAMAKFEKHDNPRDFERAKAIVTVAHLKKELGVAS